MDADEQRRWNEVFQVVSKAAWEYKTAWETGDGEDSSLILYALVDYILERQRVGR